MLTVVLSNLLRPDPIIILKLCFTGTSKTALEYSLSFCDSVLKRFDCSPNQLKVVEIASNDGTFLSNLRIKAVMFLVLILLKISPKLQMTTV